jgi:hypothetical protein
VLAKKVKSMPGLPVFAFLHGGSVSVSAGKWIQQAENWDIVSISRMVIPQ